MSSHLAAIFVVLWLAQEVAGDDGRNLKDPLYQTKTCDQRSNEECILDSFCFSCYSGNQSSEDGPYCFEYKSYCESLRRCGGSSNVHSLNQNHSLLNHAIQYAIFELSDLRIIIFSCYSLTSIVLRRSSWRDLQLPLGASLSCFLIAVSFTYSFINIPRRVAEYCDSPSYTESRYFSIFFAFLEYVTISGSDLELDILRPLTKDRIFSTAVYFSTLPRALYWAISSYLPNYVLDEEGMSLLFGLVELLSFALVPLKFLQVAPFVGAVEIIIFLFFLVRDLRRMLRGDKNYFTVDTLKWFRHAQWRWIFAMSSIHVLLLWRYQIISSIYDWPTFLRVIHVTSLIYLSLQHEILPYKSTVAVAIYRAVGIDVTPWSLSHVICSLSLTQMVVIALTSFKNSEIPGWCLNGVITILSHVVAIDIHRHFYSQDSVRTFAILLLNFFMIGCLGVTIFYVYTDYWSESALHKVHTFGVGVKFLLNQLADDPIKSRIQVPTYEEIRQGVSHMSNQQLIELRKEVDSALGYQSLPNDDLDEQEKQNDKRW